MERPPRIHNHSSMSNPEAVIALLPHDPSPLRRGPVFVASNGSPELNDMLFSAARHASSALHLPIAVIGVCEPITGAVEGMNLLPVREDLDESRRITLLADLRRAVSIATESDKPWPIHAMLGSTPSVLAREAAAGDASLLVMGIGRHSPLDRLFGTETTLATLRESRVPILAVTTTFPAMPTHVVVGMDFSAASVRAAQLGMALLASGGRLTIVHVRPQFEHPSADWQEWDAEYGRTLPPLYVQVRRLLNPPENVTIETVTVRGDPAAALMAFAHQAGADLVALGTQRHTLRERVMVGSVATRVLRASRCSVLAVPHG